MKVVIFNIILLLLVLSNLKLKSQDIHFSQFLSNPLYLSPSETGFFTEDYRFGLSHKRQWLSFTNAYQSISAFGDLKINKIKLKNSYLSAGLQINADVAGDASFGTNQVLLFASYNRYFQSDSSLQISFGTSIGVLQHGINFEKLKFGNQFDGLTYNQNIINNENFNSNSIWYEDINIGTSIQKTFKKGFVLKCGFSSLHLSKPQKSWFDSNLPVLNRKFNFYMFLDYKINEKFILSPAFLFSKQNVMKEFLYGFEFKIKTKHPTIQWLSASVFSRHKDSGILSLYIDYQLTRIGIGYDFNLSSLKYASSGRGGIEISLIYKYANKKYIPIPTRYRCPSFL